MKKISILLVLVLILGTFVLADDSPTINLNGDSEVTLEVNTEYNEQGATAQDLEDGDLTSQIVINNNININVLGDYLVTYTVTDSANNTINITRLVHVVDTTNPTIIINGDSEVTIEVKNVYEDLGATVTDNYDPEPIFDTWNEVDTLVVGDYFVNYEAVDSSGNHGTNSRLVHVVDTTKPTLTINGDSSLTINRNSVYEDLGATAEDNYDIELSIITDSNVDTSQLGDYQVKYNVKDSSNNEADQKVRDVKVVDGTSPIITLNGNSNVTIEVFNNYTEEGATAEDDIDGNLTSEIITSGEVNTSKVGVYEINYEVSDSNGNKGTEKRLVNVVDTTKPIITLNRKDQLTVYVEDGYEDEGATVTDNYDTNLTIVVNNTILSGKVGNYNITYTVTDSSGNTETVIRQVTYIFKPATPSSNGGSGGGGGGGGSSSIKKVVVTNTSLNKTELKNPADLIQKVTKKQDLTKKESSEIVKPKSSKEMAITTVEGKDAFLIKDVPQTEKAEKKELSTVGRVILASLIIIGLIGLLYYELIYKRKNEEEEENDEDLN